MTSEKWVIGIGNPLRGDDGMGWAVIAALADHAEEWGITAVSTHQLLPELIDAVYTAELIIFVDATVNGKPGTVTVTPIQPATNGNAATHQMSPAVFLALGLGLNGRMPPATLITITGQDFGYREQLSPTAEQALVAAIGQIEKIIRKKDCVL